MWLVGAKIGSEGQFVSGPGRKPLRGGESLGALASEKHNLSSMWVVDGTAGQLGAEEGLRRCQTKQNTTNPLWCMAELKLKRQVDQQVKVPSSTTCHVQKVVHKEVV